MIISEIDGLMGDPQLPISISSYYDEGEFLVINEYVSLTVLNVACNYDKSSSIPITFETDVFGDLIFTQIKGEIKIDEMTEYEFISFLTHAQRSDYDKDTFKFETDFLLIKKTFLFHYITNYQKTSMLWGGFTHPQIGANSNIKYIKTYTNIELGHVLQEFDNYSYESCVRAIEQPYAFERFLKLYHLLELQFDYYTISKIQALSIPSDSNKIGKILNEYSTKEIDRLTDLIGNYCSNIGSLETKLSSISPFAVLAEEIFINFGKSSSLWHLTDIDKFRAIVTSGNFSITNLVTEKVHQNTTIAHEKFIISLVSYWIYRIRCSIAHNKIGEYLLSWNDEKFIVEFGEPLLKDVLMQCFKK